MERVRRWFRRVWLYPVIGFELITACACNSSPASSGSRKAGATAASNNDDTHVDVMCIGDRISNSPRAFQYSYKYDGKSL